MSWLDDVFGVRVILDALGTALPRRGTLKFIGAQVTDSPSTDTTIVNFSTALTEESVTAIPSPLTFGSSRRLKYTGSAANIVLSASTVGAIDGSEITIYFPVNSTLSLSYDATIAPIEYDLFGSYASVMGYLVVIKRLGGSFFLRGQPANYS